MFTLRQANFEVPIKKEMNGFIVFINIIKRKSMYLLNITSGLLSKRAPVHLYSLIILIVTLLIFL